MSVMGVRNEWKRVLFWTAYSMYTLYCLFFTLLAYRNVFFSEIMDASQIALYRNTILRKCTTQCLDMQISCGLTSDTFNTQVNCLYELLCDWCSMTIPGDFKCVTTKQEVIKSYTLSKYLPFNTFILISINIITPP